MLSRGLHARWMKKQWCGGDATLPLSNRASKSWGHLQGTPTSPTTSSGRILMHTVVVTCRPHGCSCVAVLLRSRISSCALCPCFHCAAQHDFRMWRCLSRVLGISEHTVPECAKVLASLPLWKGGLGLRNMSRVRPAAYLEQLGRLFAHGAPQVCRWIVEHPPDVALRACSSGV